MPVLEVALRLVFVLTFLFLAAVGLSAVAAQVWAIAAARRSGAWPAVEGVLESAQVSRIVSKDPEGGQSTSFQPVVQYRYRVGDRDYKGSCIAFGRVYYFTGSRKLAERALGRHQTGSNVLMNFNPADPADSVLDPGRIGWEHAVMAALLLGFAAVVWFFAVVS